ncbi:MAG: transposase [Firmicutes bacterium]|nr:transposase [Bacillota bacterium]
MNPSRPGGVGGQSAAHRAGSRHVFFSDAAHFVLGAWLGYLWCRTRILLPTPSGRKRFNVLGALHAVITVTSDTYINSDSVVTLLKNLAERFTDLPITLVLDNARYQRNVYVMSEAERLGITLLWLPTYSPNLHLMERLWKFVKADCLHGRY